ncbi:MAG TPA: hypothetical protein DCF93_03595 [Desulfuromonas sp.]|nr:hypothetical protein [Desulfuromonas sp.]
MGGDPQGPQCHPPLSAQPGQGGGMTRSRSSTFGVILLLAVLLGNPGRAVAADEAHIFIYHRFGEPRYPSTNVSLSVFADQLQVLKAAGANVVTLGTLLGHLRAGTPLPERCVVITVDDAFTSFGAGGLPLLRRFGYPVTLFINSDSIGSAGYLTWDEIRRLARAGVEIGNQSASHDYLLDRRRGESPAQWRERVRRDLLRAQETLSRELGVTPTLFAYPYGEYDPELVEIVREIGFVGAVMQNSGVVDRSSDRFLLPRFPMGGPYATMAGFREKLALRPLPVTVLAPSTPVRLEESSPELIIVIAEGDADLSRLQCFVDGQPTCLVTRHPTRAGTYFVRAREAISGRRNKYVLTAPGRRKGEWFWFSQLWIRPNRP